ncbi:ran-specific GTPase-activating protein-like [Anneissia japonica]|uniref:ran-specific GTPase-activating protein-like n=1 Tax=Anneissia japonica TaxID=1529436 RepID=UPI0014258207|nr:ran-specific GTPase-activating protein-like [Anneissia japonica]
MELKANCDSDRAFVWNTPADFADEEPKAETLAIRFANAENAKKFKTAFEDCQQSLSNAEEKKDKEKPAEEEEKPVGDADTVAEKLGEMTVKDGNKGDEPNNDTSKVQNGDSNVSSKDETKEKEK